MLDIRLRINSAVEDLATGRGEEGRKRMPIDWMRAPSVPTDVLLAQAQGLPLSGEIVEGPLGQKTFVPHRQVQVQQSRPIHPDAQNIHVRKA